MSDSLRPHESQLARPTCPSPTPGVYPNSCPSSWWCHPAISSSVVLIIFHVYFHWGNRKERELEKRAEDYELPQYYVGLWALSHPWLPWQLGEAVSLSPFYKSRNREGWSIHLSSTYHCSVMEPVSILGLVQQRSQWKSAKFLVSNIKEYTPSISLFSPSSILANQKKLRSRYQTTCWIKILECYNFNWPKAKQKNFVT